MEKTRPHETVEGWLRSYVSWQSRIELLESQRSHIPELTQHFEQLTKYGHSKPSESVLQEVIHRLQISDELPILKLRVHLLGIALTALIKEEREFVEAKYFNRVSNPLIMDRLHLSRSGLFRMRKAVLEKVYRLFGGSTSLMWIEIPDAEYRN